MNDMPGEIRDADEEKFAALAGRASRGLFRYLASPAFWVRGWLLWVLFLSGIFLYGYFGVPLFGSSLEELVRDPAFMFSSVIFLGTFLLGFWTTIKSISMLEREEALALFAYERALKFGQNYKGGKLTLVVDDRTDRRFLPAGARGAKSTIIKNVVANLCQNAYDMRFEPVSTTTQTFLAPLTEGTRRVRTWQTIGLRSGILFTFVGLMLAISKLSSTFELGSGVNEQEVIRDLVGELSLSFGTSVAGLFAAILLQFLVLRLRPREVDAINRMEAAAQEVSSVLSRAQHENPIVTHVQALQKQLAMHRQAMAEMSGHVAESLMKTDTALDRQTDAIDNGFKSLEHVKASFSKASDDFSASLEKITASLTAMDREQEGVAESWKRHAEQQSELQVSALAKVEEAVLASNERLADALKAERDRQELSSLDKRLEEGFGEMQQRLSSLVSGVENALKSQKAIAASVKGQGGVSARQWPWACAFGAFALLWLSLQVWPSWLQQLPAALGGGEAMAETDADQDQQP